MNKNNKINSKFFADFMFKNPDKSSQIGATYCLSALCNYDYFISVFKDNDIEFVCRFVSCLCYFCNDSLVFKYDHYLDNETANLSTIHDYIVKFCALLGKK